jgi:hypothetical protein
MFWPVLIVFHTVCWHFGQLILFFIQFGDISTGFSVVAASSDSFSAGSIRFNDSVAFWPVAWCVWLILLGFRTIWLFQSLFVIKSSFVTRWLIWSSVLGENVRKNGTSVPILKGGKMPLWGYGDVSPMRCHMARSPYSKILYLFLYIAMDCECQIYITDLYYVMKYTNLDTFQPLKIANLCVTKMHYEIQTS